MALILQIFLYIFAGFYSTVITYAGTFAFLQKLKRVCETSFLWKCFKFGKQIADTFWNANILFHDLSLLTWFSKKKILQLFSEIDIPSSQLFVYQIWSILVQVYFKKHVVCTCNHFSWNLCAMQRFLNNQLLDFWCGSLKNHIVQPYDFSPWIPSSHENLSGKSKTINSGNSLSGTSCYKNSGQKFCC